MAESLWGAPGTKGGVGGGSKVTIRKFFFQFGENFQLVTSTKNAVETMLLIQMFMVDQFNGNYRCICEWFGLFFVVVTNKIIFACTIPLLPLFPLFRTRMSLANVTHMHFIVFPRLTDRRTNVQFIVFPG